MLQGEIIRKPIKSMIGFTLLELLIAVAIIAVIGAIGTPIVSGLLKDSKIEVAKNNLLSIYTAQTEYKSDNGKYYYTGGGNKTAFINTALFNGTQILELNGDYYYYINGNNTSYTAYAYPLSSNLQRCQITHLKQVSCY